MAEVFASRSTHNPRPLGELKETRICFDDEGNQIITERCQRHETVASARRKTKHNFKRMKELRDSIGRTSVISIVASMESVPSKNSPMTKSQKPNVAPMADPMNNTMAMLSNLVLRKDRAISIPHKQGNNVNAINLSPKNKKTYSENVDPMIQFASRSKTFVCPEKPENGNKRTVQFANDVMFLKEGRDGKEKLKYPKEAMSPPKTPLEKQRQVLRLSKRQLTNLSKNETRITTQLAKCDAVDIMESKARTEYMQMATSAMLGQTKDSSVVDNCPSIPNDLKAYRAKSLPSIFPIKRNKTVIVPETLDNKNANNVVKLFANETLNSTFPNTHKEYYPATDNPYKSTLISNDIEAMERKSSINRKWECLEDSKPLSEAKAPKEISMNSKLDENGNIRSLSSNIMLEGCSFASGVSALKTSMKQKEKGEFTVPVISFDEHHKINTNSPEIDEKLAMLCKQPPLKTYERKSTRCTKSAHEFSGEKFPDDQEVFKVKSRAQSSKEIRATTASCRNKKVAFDESTMQKLERSKTTLSVEDVHDVSMIKATGVANTLFNAPERPMTMELLKLQERILMGRVSQKTVRKKSKKDTTTSGLKDSKYARNLLQVPDCHSEHSDNMSDFHGYTDLYLFGDPDATNRTSTQVPKSFGASSFYPDIYDNPMYDNDSYEDNDDILDEDYDFDNDSIDENTPYRMVKAVDLGALSGFQHRKFRKPSVKETTSTHFIKIKMKEF